MTENVKIPWGKIVLFILLGVLVVGATHYFGYNKGFENGFTFVGETLDASVYCDVADDLLAVADVDSFTDQDWKAYNIDVFGVYYAEVVYLMGGK